MPCHDTFQNVKFQCFSNRKSTNFIKFPKRKSLDLSLIQLVMLINTSVIFDKYEIVFYACSDHIGLETYAFCYSKLNI